MVWRGSEKTGKPIMTATSPSAATRAFFTATLAEADPDGGSVAWLGWLALAAVPALLGYVAAGVEAQPGDCAALTELDGALGTPPTQVRPLSEARERLNAALARCQRGEAWPCGKVLIASSILAPAAWA